VSKEDSNAASGTKLVEVNLSNNEEEEQEQEQKPTQLVSMVDDFYPLPTEIMDVPQNVKRDLTPILSEREMELKAKMNEEAEKGVAAILADKELSTIEHI